MKAIALFLALTAAACSCATVGQPQEAAMADLLDSTVYVDIDINTTKMIPGPKGLEEGAKGLIGTMGTGVVYWKSSGELGPVKSKIITAHHVLETPAVGSLQLNSDGSLTRIDSVKIAIITRKGQRCNLTVLKTGASDTRDVATALVDCDAGRVAPISAFVPPPGALVTTVGHAAGVRPAIITQGFVSGWNSDGYLVMSVPVVQGSSGGGIWYEGRLVGILVRVLAQFDHASFSVPLEQIQARIAESED